MVHSRNSQLTSRLTEALLLGALIITPLLVVPVFTNFLMTGKILAVFIVTLIVVSCLWFENVRQQALGWIKHPLAWPLGLFGLSTLVSTFLAQPYPVENLMGWGGIYFSGVCLALIGGMMIRPPAARSLETALSWSGILIALLTLTQIAGYGPSHLIERWLGQDLPHTSLFNLTGSLFIAVQLLVVLGLTLGAKIWRERKASLLTGSSLLLILVTLLVGVFFLWPGQPASPIIIPFSVSWSLSLDTLKNIRTAAIGVGPEYFNGVYNQFRPIWTNSSPWANVSFSQATNFPLTLLATMGLLGLGSWLWLGVTVIRHSRTSPTAVTTPMILVVATLALQLFFPLNVLILLFQAVGLAYWLALDPATKHTSLKLKSVPAAPDFWFSWILPAIVCLAILAGGGYLIGRAFLSSYWFSQATTALQKNEVVTGYNLQQRAVQLNPYVSTYRSNYAVTNLAIATGLANKTDITDAEKEQISQLLQQAIREGRAATVLRPDLSSNWQILAQIYRNLIGTVEGADQWTITSFVSAIEVAPLDADLRLELGGVMYQLEQYEQAATFFNQAIQLNPNLQNAYYNLAHTLKQLKQLANAEKVYQKLLTLLTPETAEYDTVQKELAEIQAELKKTAAEATDQATTKQSPLEQQSLLPSLNQQQLTETDQEVVAPPSDQPLTTNQPVATSSATVTSP